MQSCSIILILLICKSPLEVVCNHRLKNKQQTADYPPGGDVQSSEQFCNQLKLSF